MKDLLAKLKVGQQDADTKKVLESIGITPDFLKKVEVIEKPETLDKALDDFDFRGEFDRRISKAVSTNENTLKEKFEFVPKAQEKKEEGKTEKEDKKDNDNPLLAAIEALQNEIKEIKAEKEQQSVQSKKEKALELLKSKNIPEVYLSKFDLEKPLDEQVTEVEETFTKDTETIIKRTNPNIKLPNPKTPTNKLNPESVERFKKIF